MQFVTRHRRALLLLAALSFATTAVAAITGAWTVNGSTSASSTVLGVTTTYTGDPGNPYGNATLNSTNYWLDPYGATVNGGPSLLFNLSPLAGVRTYVVTFSAPVDNPVLHVDRVGGYTAGRVSNSSVWTLTGAGSSGGGVTMSRLSGNAPFVVSGASFQRIVGDPGLVTTECRNDSLGTGCGSIRFNGTGVTSLTFDVEMQGGLVVGDAIEFRWSFPVVADLSITKTNNSASVLSGSTTTYVVTATNNGPNAVVGAVVGDTPTAGLTCPPANPVTCNSTATPSACPAGPLTVANLQSGVALGNLPATAGSNTVSFSFSCMVQ